jgi:hypothetical protein
MQPAARAAVAGAQERASDAARPVVGVNEEQEQLAVLRVRGGVAELSAPPTRAVFTHHRAGRVAREREAPAPTLRTPTHRV